MTSDKGYSGGPWIVELQSLTSMSMIDLALHVMNIPNAKCEVGEEPNKLQHYHTLINFALLGYLISNSYVLNESAFQFPNQQNTQISCLSRYQRK